MGVDNSPTCRYEEINQNLNHIFWACPLLNSKRDAMYKFFRELLCRSSIGGSFSMEERRETHKNTILLF